MTAILFSLLIFCIYLGWIIHHHGIPASISESYMLLPAGWQKILFTLFCFTVGFTLLPHWMETTSTHYKPFVMAAVAGLMFVGGAPAFYRNRTLEQVVHYTGAVLAVIGSQVWIINCAHLWWVSTLCFIIAGSACYLLWRRASRKADRPVFPNIVFWVEVWAFASLYAALIYKTIWA